MKNFRTTDGLQLAYDDQGRGTPLLCLAGLTRNMDDFEPVVDHFAGRARIIRLDSRGRGASDFAPDPMTYSVMQEAADALALLDHLGLERAAILGTSRGGLIAMTLAFAQKSRLSGVLLIDIGPDIAAAGLAFIKTYLGAPPPFATLADAVAGLPARMAPRFRNVPAATWADFTRRCWSVAADGTLGLRYDPRLRDAIEAQSAGLEPPDLWPLFGMLEGLPLGLIRGANSDLLTAETAARMRDLRPDLDYAEIPDRGHVPFLDEPGSIAAIARFLERLT
jgi:pimeloyl-ACP methyl ester carboxylesterase